MPLRLKTMETWIRGFSKNQRLQRHISTNVEIIREFTAHKALGSGTERHKKAGTYYYDLHVG